MDPVESYLRDLLTIRSTGGNVPETSFYPALANLLDEAGKTLKPKVRCVSQVADTGAGSPDFGLYTAQQFQRARDSEPLPGQLPGRGVIEVKPVADDSWVTAEGEQVSRYWGHYGQVLVTNYRDFVFIGRDENEEPCKLETYRLADSEAEFWALCAHPRKAAREHGERFVEYLRRVMLCAAPLSDPQQVAWYLASYAREAKARVEAAGDLPGLASLRKGLEEALGASFEGEKGDHFFRATLVQTLFYGVFSSWVLWSRREPPNSDARFNWHEAGWSLHVPIIASLFDQIATRQRLHPLGLDQVMDWTGMVLNRVVRDKFFERFQEQHAVQYFYEPFLEAYDPELRKELGVWYTPPEIVKYQVERVDRVLREELDIEDGLADPNVYVLDPCCGTGAYLVEVLRKVHETLEARGEGALTAQKVKQAARDRVFGFEILPAPFVVSHLQLGLLLQQMGAPLANQGNERAAVYLTNALTGWEPPKEPKTALIFPELEQERDAAEKVKREVPILVILGNPPYNGFAGLGMAEERDLSVAYRTTKRAPKPQGQGLNDLYVRFFRMAERRIVESTQRGVVCFISNYSWLDGLSHTGMRERYIEAFDRIWIDCLNGDKYKTGKLTPDGRPDPSVFSTPFNREGIQVGTAIALLVNKRDHEQTATVSFRHLWGKDKRAELLASVGHDGKAPYDVLRPQAEVGYPFMPSVVAEGYLLWPKLPELFPVSFPGVKTSRDEFVVDIDRDRLEERLRKYFDRNVSHEEMRRIAPAAMTKTARFPAEETRQQLIRRGFLPQNIVRYCYRPFDVRWLYWEPETKLLDEKRSDYFPHVQEGNPVFTSRQKRERDPEGTPFYVSAGLIDWHLTRPGSIAFPLEDLTESLQKEIDFGKERGNHRQRANVSENAQEYLKGLHQDADEASETDVLWGHTVAVGNSGHYLAENAGALWQDFPRIPLPDTKDALLASADLGRKVAALLDTEQEVPAVTTGRLRPEMTLLAVPDRVGGGSLDPGRGDLDLSAGWGHAGRGGVCMPGRGRVEERDYLKTELVVIEEGARRLGMSLDHALAQLGPKTCDVYLNDAAFWRCVPAGVWEYRIGGYQVVKKWLSYREKALLGRGLKLDEAEYVTRMVRRIAAILLLHPALDANYESVKRATYPWPQG